MKTKVITTIMITLFLASIVAIATPVRATGGYIELSTSGTGVSVEWSTEQAHSGSFSVKMTIQAGSGSGESGGRIMINVWDLNKKLTDIDPSTTLDGQLNHLFWAFQPTPFLTDFPYFRIDLDTNDDGVRDVMLIAMGTHTLRPEQKLPADAPTSQWIRLTEIGGGEVVDDIGYVEGTQYWRPIPYTEFVYHVLQYWQAMYPTARVIRFGVICGFWGTPRPSTVSIYIDDIKMFGLTFDLEPTSEDAIELLEDLETEINALSDGDFKPPAAFRKTTLFTKIDVVIKQIGEGEYAKAASKLDIDIKEKLDCDSEGDWLVLSPTDPKVTDMVYKIDLTIAILGIL